VALGAVAAAVLAVVAWRWVGPVRGTAEQWPVRIDGATIVAAAETELGSEKQARTVHVGPDVIEVAVSARVELLERTKVRTRLRLRQGVLSARVEPGHEGRQFIVDSAPYRVTVVGTVFEARRDGPSLQVDTREGVVRVERLGDAGQVMETRRVAAGESVRWPPEPVPQVHDAGAAPALELEPELTERVPRSMPSTQALATWRRRAARGECEDVVRETTAALKVAPRHVGTLRVFADCARKLGQPGLALQSYRQVIAARGSASETAEAILLGASLAQDELHDERAVLSLTTGLAGLKGAPESVMASAYVRRARALAALGRSAEARVQVELVLRQFSSTPAAAEALRLQSELTGR
jgi:hypothetical protein